MLDWLKRSGTPASRRHDADPQPAKPQGRAMSGKYQLLYKYLENRYATTVVLTFNEIEDLLGFALPDQARLNREWWTDGKTEGSGNYSDSWILASRTALPNMMAGTVAFERGS